MKSKHVISMGVLQKKFKLCQSRAANSIVKWYHANSRFSLNSNFLVKPFYLTRGFATFRCCHWLYLGTVDSFLSVSDTRTWDLILSCIFDGKIKRSFFCLTIWTFHVKISQNLSFHFLHITYGEPHIFPGSKICPGLWIFYIQALSVSNFSLLNTLFLSILLIFLVR